MTSAAKTELQVGRLSPEDADRFASMFRPAWELDDAPFASGTKLSAAEMDALAGGAGVNSEVTAHSAPRFPPARTDSKPPEASIVVAADPVPAPAPRAPAPAVASAVPQAQAQAPRRSQRPPAAAAAPARAPAPPRNALDSGDFTPPKKSNTGIIIAVAAVAVLGVGGIIAKFALGGDTPKPNPVATQPTQTTEERHIPPPPTDIDTPPNPTGTAATTTATATATADKPTPPPTATQTAAATATATATARPTTTAATTAPTATGRPTATAAATTRPTGAGTGKPNTGKGTGGIVRDTPF